MSNNDITMALQLIRRTLIENLPLQNLVEGRVYTSHFIDYDNQTTPMPLVIVDPSGGNANYSMQVQRINFHLYGYSEKSSAEAGNVYHKSYVALNAQALARSTLSMGGYIYELERPITGFNDDIRGWFYRGTFVLNSAG
jgi:hypothetical protein